MTIDASRPRFDLGLNLGRSSAARRLGLTGLAGLLLVLAGCGSSSSSSSNPLPGAPYQSNLTSPQLCSRLTPAALTPIINANWGPSPTPGPSVSGSASCAVASQGLSGGVLSIEINQLSGQVSFQDKLKNNALQLKPVNGVGDQAAFSNLAAGSGSSSTLVVEKGKSLFVIVLISTKASTGHELDSLKKVYDLVSS